MPDTWAVVKELISSNFLLIFPLNIKFDLAKSTKTTLTISPRYFPAMYFSNLKKDKSVNKFEDEKSIKYFYHTNLLYSLELQMI